MAKLTNPLMSQDARGSVAGVQFSKNTAGAFGSRKSTGTRSQQPNAIAYRAQLGTAHHAFDALTDAQKDTWNLTPDTHVKPREHFLKLYLRRAARGLTQFTGYPGHYGDFFITNLDVERGAGLDSILYCSWILWPFTAGYLDFVVRSTYLHSYDGHQRKFHWAKSGVSLDEFVNVPPGPYGRFLTLQLSALDWNTFKLYRRWVYHWNAGVLESVTPPPP